MVLSVTLYTRCACNVCALLCLFSGRGAVLFRNLENYSGIKSFKEQAIRRKGPKGRGVRKSKPFWNSRAPSAGLLQAGAAVPE